MNSYYLGQKSFSKLGTCFDSHILNDDLLSWNSVLFRNCNLAVKNMQYFNFELSVVPILTQRALTVWLDCQGYAKGLENKY